MKFNLILSTVPLVLDPVCHSSEPDSSSDNKIPFFLRLVFFGRLVRDCSRTERYSSSLSDHSTVNTILQAKSTSTSVEAIPVKAALFSLFLVLVHSVLLWDVYRRHLSHQNHVRPFFLSVDFPLLGVL